MKCRICGSGNYKSILDLGSIYPSNFVTNTPDVEPKPLHLVQCNDCDLVQLEETFDLDEMYKEHYWYRSSLNKSMVESLKDVVDKALQRKPDAKYVLDIGCNDGTLLSMYPNIFFKVGVDPSKNVKESAEQHCNVFINDYFHIEPTGYDLLQYDIITAIAMFYDLEEPNKFLEDINAVLADDGIFIIQFTDLLSTVRLNAFDNICHEHLEYYTLASLLELLWKHNLLIFDLEYNKVNGGSIRVYAKKMFKYEEMPAKIADALEDEADFFEQRPLADFNATIQKEKSKLLNLIAGIKSQGKSIYVLGASTKGNTLLQYYGLDNTVIEKALEVNKDKFGLRTIGSNIPIISEEEGLKENPDYLLVLPWGFREFFVNKFKNSGIKLIFPLPEVEVIEA